MIQFFQKFIYYGISICDQEWVLSTRGVQPELGSSIVLVGCSMWFTILRCTLNSAYNEKKYAEILLCYRWLLHHVVPITWSIVPLYSLDQDNSNNVQFFGHVRPLILASVKHNAKNSIINGIIPFVRLRWSKWYATRPFWSHDAIQGHQYQHHDVSGIICQPLNLINKSRWSKGHAALHFWSFDATDTSIDIMCQCQ